MTDEYDAEAVAEEAGEYEDEWDDEEGDYEYADQDIERRYGAAAAAGAAAGMASQPGGARYVPPGPDRLPSNQPITDNGRGGGRYFLIPVMVAVLGLIGVGVVLLYNALSDDDDETIPIATESPTEDEETATEEPEETPTEDEETPAPTETTEEPTATATAPPSGSFTPGQTVVVTGVGECLNVRSTPDSSVDDNILTCAPEGAEMTIVAESDLVDGTQWWEVDYEGTQGFSAGEFLAPAE
jgi:hypothetical protein